MLTGRLCPCPGVVRGQGPGAAAGPAPSHLHPPSPLSGRGSARGEECWDSSTPASLSPMSPRVRHPLSPGRGPGSLEDPQRVGARGAELQAPHTVLSAAPSPTGPAGAPPSASLRSTGPAASSPRSSSEPGGQELGEQPGHSPKRTGQEAWAGAGQGGPWPEPPSLRPHCAPPLPPTPQDPEDPVLLAAASAGLGEKRRAGCGSEQREAGGEKRVSPQPGQAGLRHGPS